MAPLRRCSPALRSQSTVSSGRSSCGSLSSTFAWNDESPTKSILMSNSSNNDASSNNHEVPNKTKFVRFSSLEIIEFNTILGDNPSVSRGPALALGFTKAASIRMDVNQYEEFRCSSDSNIDEEEQQEQPSSPQEDEDVVVQRDSSIHSENSYDDCDSFRRHRRRTSSNEFWYYSTHQVPRRFKDDLKLSLCERADILLCEGYTTKEIIHAGKLAEQCQKQREQSFRNQKWDSIQEFFEEKPWNLREEEHHHDPQQKEASNTGGFRMPWMMFCPPAPIAAT